MPEVQAFPVTTTRGRRGRVFRRARFLDRNETNRVELDDGTQLNVSAAALIVQKDGSFLLDDGGRAEPAPQQARQPEQQPVKAVQAPVRQPEPRSEQLPEEEVVHTMTAAKTDEPITINDPLFTEDVQVEKVPVNRILDAPVQVRQEGDTTVIPVIEEVVIVQKKLLLREEVRITRRRTEVRQPRRIIIDEGQVRTYGADGREIQAKP